MSGSGDEHRAHEDAAIESASGEAAPATPGRFSPELADDRYAALNPLQGSVANAEPFASASPVKQVQKSKAGPKAKPKTRSSPLVKKVEDVLDKDTLSAHLLALKDEQQRAKNERKRLAAEIRNAERRKSRLRKRAKLLTDEDLLQVLMLRKGAREAQEAVASETPGASSGLRLHERPG